MSRLNREKALAIFSTTKTSILFHSMCKGVMSRGEREIQSVMAK
jgi:hypothetical protein